MTLKPHDQSHLTTPPKIIIRNEYTCDVLVYFGLDGAFDGRLAQGVVKRNNIGGKGFARGFYDGGFVEENLYAGHTHTNRQSATNQQCINRKYFLGPVIRCSTSNIV